MSVARVDSFEVPALFEVDPALSIPSILQARFELVPDDPIVAVRDGRGQWGTTSARQLLRQIQTLARGFVAAGIGVGDRVGIMARTSDAWVLADFALIWIGAVTVPIYESSSVDQIRWIGQDAGLSAVIVEDAKHKALVLEAVADLPQMGPIWVIAEGALDAVAAGGKAEHQVEAEARRAALRGDDLATIIYTSGTTGRPKGVELIHTNIIQVSLNLGAELSFICAPPSRLLLFLPLAHSFARVIVVIALAAGSTIGFSPTLSTLLDDLKSFKPTYILAVPRVLEKVYNAAEQSTGGGFKLSLFRWAAKVAIVSSRELDSRGGLTFVRRLQHRLCWLLVYRKLQATMGGELLHCVSGGAPLGERLGHFFRGIGLTVYEGYGLTETSAPTSVNRQRPNKIGTVGPPVPGSAAMIAPNGELLVKGPHVFRGYHNNPAATAEAFDEAGWFRTGDLGAIDDDGYITITGRAKELIVTAGGKNVAPAILEDRLRGHPLVSQCVVVGDKRPYIAALITLDVDMLPGWLASHGKSPLTLAQALIDPDVRTSLERAITRANQVVSRPESIREFRILPVDFTEENGYLTPSLKVRRGAILRDFAGDIDALYAEALAKREAARA